MVVKAKHGRPGRKPVHRLGVRSRWQSFKVIDARTYEGKVIGSIKAALTAHLGGKPSAAEAIIIELVAFNALRTVMLHNIMAKDMEQSPTLLDDYILKFTGSVTSGLKDLGLKSPMKELPSLGAYLEARSA
jgi:hypothetical protein